MNYLENNKNVCKLSLVYLFNNNPQWRHFKPTSYSLFICKYLIRVNFKVKNEINLCSFIF